ncbi:MAG TPA: aminotransferase class V-fold PLP-dependent enzyme, partial [Deferrisomatales bacterium]|nr:aminotransferase class V-fold PLP-dependent enzyme [Deferrisomatales bacterium]
TEANDLALHLLSVGATVRGFAVGRIEHPSVLGPLAARAAKGWEVTWLPVGEDGRVIGAELPAAGVGFGVLQAANHETGALQPLAFAAERWSAAGLPWHCDAVQAWGRVPLLVEDLGCATASLSGHKLGAPKGVGALFVRRGTSTQGRLLGGMQERGLRAGTENLPGIAALAAACNAAATDREGDATWCASLRDRLQAGALAAHELARVNGPGADDQRLPNTVNLSFPGIPGELLVQALDLEGVAVSAGSACASGASDPSPVLQAMGLPPWRVASAVRVSLGGATRAGEVDAFLAALGRVLHRLRGTGG